ncbi:hypothetical protein S245_029678, partial [Arachis hypogaea]
MHFSALDEKLEKGVVEALSIIIREAVMDGITMVLPKFVEMVGSSSKIESHGVKFSNTALAVTPPSDSLKRFLDVKPAMYLGDEPVTKKKTLKFKGRKRGLPVSEVKICRKNYIFGRSSLQAVHDFITIITIQIWMENIDGDDMSH